MVEECPRIEPDLSTECTGSTVETTVETDGEAKASSRSEKRKHTGAENLRMGVVGGEKRARWRFARSLRNRATHAERILWQYLRRRQLGVRFRRQSVLLGWWIADFYCPSQKLVIEIDGLTHVGRELADAKRDAELLS